MQFLDQVGKMNNSESRSGNKLKKAQIGFSGLLVKTCQKYSRWYLQNQICTYLYLKLSKGQLISKADWRAIDSPKKRTGEFVLFAFLFFTANKSNSSVRFFWRIYGSPICFLKLTDLQDVKYKTHLKLIWYLIFICEDSPFKKQKIEGQSL